MAATGVQGAETAGAGEEGGRTGGRPSPRGGAVGGPGRCLTACSPPSPAAACCTDTGPAVPARRPAGSAPPCWGRAPPGLAPLASSLCGARQVTQGRAGSQDEDASSPNCKHVLKCLRSGKRKKGFAALRQRWVQQSLTPAPCGSLGAGAGGGPLPAGSSALPTGSLLAPRLASFLYLHLAVKSV